MTGFKIMALSVAVCCSVGAASAKEICHGPKRPDLPDNDYIGTYPTTRILESVYNYLRSDSVLSTGDCSCARRYPSYDKAYEVYMSDFAKLPRNGGSIPRLDQFMKDAHSKTASMTRDCRLKGY